MSKILELKLPTDALQRLEDLKIKIEADDYGEVIANALKMYEWMVFEGGEDARVIINRSDGTTAIMPVFEKG